VTDLGEKKRTNIQELTCNIDRGQDLKEERRKEKEGIPLGVLSARGREERIRKRYCLRMFHSLLGEKKGGGGFFFVGKDGKAEGCSDGFGGSV